MKTIPSSELLPGDVLAEPVASRTGFVIFSAGDVLTTSHISTILHWGIESIAVERPEGTANASAAVPDPRDSLASPPSPPQDRTRPAAASPGLVESPPPEHAAPPRAAAPVRTRDLQTEAMAAPSEPAGPARDKIWPAEAQARPGQPGQDMAAKLREILAERFHQLDTNVPQCKFLLSLAAERHYKLLLSDAQAHGESLVNTAAVATKRPEQPDLRPLLNYGRSLGTVPLIFHRLNEAINKPRVNIEEITAIVSVDPDLMARLLKLVNSPYYGFATKITNISRAIALVGLQQIVALALSASLVAAFKGVPMSLISMEAFWSHSICCGVAARLIARHGRLHDPEHYFIAGLLHDIGRLLIYTQLPAHSLYMLSDARRRKQSLRSLEREILGTTHDLLGQKLLEAWNFPLDLRLLIGAHHRPITDNSTSEECVISTANLLAQTLGYGTSGESMASPLDPAAWEKLGLSTNVLGALCHQLDTEYKELRVQLSTAMR